MTFHAFPGPGSVPPLSEEDRGHVLRHTADAWEEAGRQRRWFVTGGTGFFGCWLLETFAYVNTVLQLDSRLAVLTRDPDAFRRRLPHLAADPAITLIRGDVRTFGTDLVRDQLAATDWPENHSSEFDGIIHAATMAGPAVAAGDAMGLIEAEVDGTRRALKFARETGARRFLCVSSGAVYGPQPGTIHRLPEEHLGGPDPTAPNAAYGEGKRASETFCACAARQFGLSATIARAFAFVGPHLPLDGHYAVGNFLRDRLTGRTVEVKGNGLPVRSYLYAADLAVWLWTIFLRGAPGRAYNVGSEEPLTIAETAALVAQTGVEGIGSVDVTIADQMSGNDGVTLSSQGRYVPSTLRAQTELDLRQRITFQEAIRRTLAWQRSV